MNFRLYLETALKLTLQYIVPLILMTLVMAIISITTFFMLSPVMMAGYIHAILRMIREGREPVIQDIFSQFRLFFKSLPLFVLIVFLFTIIRAGSLLFVILSFIVLFICLYALSMMTDKDMGMVSSVRQTCSVISQRERIVDYLTAAILFACISCTVIGLPLAAVFVMIIYEDQVNQHPVHSMFTPEPK